MTEELQESLKKFLITTSIFIFLAIVISVLAFFIKPRYEENLKKNVEELLAISQKEPIQLITASEFKKTSFSALSAWSIEGKKHTDEFVFALAITGDCGPYTGVFLFSKNNGAQFCGLLGLPQSIENSKQFGITDRIIRYRVKMIETIAERGGLLQ